MGDLPFQKPTGQRKFQCFVCGVEFDEFEVFKDHIIESHEEGREYIKCPLARCGAPIRDVRGHFKVKHPHEKLPSGVAFRPVIWKDFGGNKKGKVRKPNFRKGSMVSTKMNGTEMHYDSGWECEVFECLETLNEVTRYFREPVRIPYLHKGTMHDYLPDLRVEFSDGGVEIWEIKPSNQTSNPKNQDKWRSAQEWCKARGWDFIVMTEKGIGKLKKITRGRKNND